MPARDPAVTSRIMSRIRSKNTKGEIALGKALWRVGLRYRKQYPIFGRPDFVMVTARVAVFCDGDFWHGRDFEERLKAGRFQNNKEYWVEKITRNRIRDKEVNLELRKRGWKVARFWESFILSSPDKAANRVLSIVRKQLRTVR